MGKTLVWILMAGLSACTVADEDEIAALERQVAELERELEKCEDCEKELARLQYELMLCRSMDSD